MDPPYAARDPTRSTGRRRRWSCSFDLCFVVAVAQAADGLHHGLAEGHPREALIYAIHLDRLRPGLLRRLMLCEAIARPVPQGRSPENPMVAIALRRRVVWPSRAEMIASYGGRPPLDRVAPEALEAYVEWGTVRRADGTVELSCPPEVEAAIFGSPPAVEGVRAADHRPFG